MLERLRRQLSARQERLTALLSINDRDLTQDELREFDGLTATEGDESIAAMQERITQVQDIEARAARAQTVLAPEGETQPEQRASAPATVTSEPATYRRGGQASYFRDLMAVSLQREGARGASERLERNDREVVDGLRQERALTTVDGVAGEFVPPLWMVNEYVELARAARVTADLCRQGMLPPGTDSINLPKISTGTSTAEQTTQNTAVSNTDLATTSVPMAVATIAGQQVAAVQLIEQSPINMDDVILGDLAADYAVRLDTFVINNNATGKVGFLNVSGINAVTYTDATPTVGELYPKVADGIQLIHTNRFMPPDAIVMHPRRWAWFLAAVDSSGRPLVTPDGQGPQNNVAEAGAVASEGYVGKLQGLPVYVDANVPINLGAGTNEDRIIIARFADSWLYEGSQRAEAFRETKADQLSVLFRFYNYAAFTAARFAKSTSVISGTGLVTPTF